MNYTIIFIYVFIFFISRNNLYHFILCIYLKQILFSDDYLSDKRIDHIYTYFITKQMMLHL